MQYRFGLFSLVAYLLFGWAISSFILFRLISPFIVPLRVLGPVRYEQVNLDQMHTIDEENKQLEQLLFTINFPNSTVMALTVGLLFYLLAWRNRVGLRAQWFEEDLQLAEQANYLKQRKPEFTYRPIDWGRHRPYKTSKKEASSEQSKGQNTDQAIDRIKRYRKLD